MFIEIAYNRKRKKKEKQGMNRSIKLPHEMTDAFTPKLAIAFRPKKEWQRIGLAG
jgi:hypothetical protein